MSKVETCLHYSSYVSYNAAPVSTWFSLPNNLGTGNRHIRWTHVGENMCRGSVGEGTNPKCS